MIALLRLNYDRQSRGTASRRQADPADAYFANIPCGSQPPPSSVIVEPVT